MCKIEEIIELFRDIDNETRLQLLLDYSKKLPAIPEKYRSIEQKEIHRIAECRTPVSLWIEVAEGKVYIYADVPAESPTVKGFIALLVASFNGLAAEEVENAPTNILQKTGLDKTLGMMRMQGLNAIYQRIKNETHLARISALQDS